MPLTRNSGRWFFKLAAEPPCGRGLFGESKTDGSLLCCCGFVLSLLFLVPCYAQNKDAVSSECGRVDANGKLYAPTHGKDRRVQLEPGDWTEAAVSLENTWHLLDKNPGRRACFYSPDGQKLVDIDGEDVTLVVNGHKNATDFGRLPNPELGWSPDSKRFFVTWTDGGEEGQWQVQVYEIRGETFASVNDSLTDAARHDFEARIRALPIDPTMKNPRDRTLWWQAEYCEPANVVAAKWLNGGSELLISALVVNVPGRCRYGGEFNVYRIRIPDGAILQRYTAEEAHRIFGGHYLPLIVR